jgi:hypothetical protein
MTCNMKSCVRKCGNVFALSGGGRMSLTSFAGDDDILVGVAWLL